MRQCSNCLYRRVERIGQGWDAENIHYCGCKRSPNYTEETDAWDDCEEWESEKER